MLMVAPEYVPWGTFIREIGSTVPIRCIISTGVDDDTTLTVPPLPLVSVMDPMVMLTATSRSEGESPRLTWRAVVFGWGFGEEEDVPPPQPSSDSNDMNRAAHTVYIANCHFSCSNQFFMIFNLRIRFFSTLDCYRSFHPDAVGTGLLSCCQPAPD